MGCKCGRRRMVATDTPKYTTSFDIPGDVTIAANATFVLNDLQVKVGRTTKVSLAAATDLLSKGAPIWILS